MVPAPFQQTGAVDQYQVCRRHGERAAGDHNSSRSGTSRTVSCLRRVRLSRTHIGPVDLYVARTSVRDLPATFLDCRTLTVLEWHPGHWLSLTPVTKHEPLVSHSPPFPLDMSHPVTQSAYENLMCL